MNRNVSLVAFKSVDLLVFIALTGRLLATKATALRIAYPSVACN